MPPSPQADHRSNVIGSLWMVAAMALFAFEDTFFKAAATSLGVAQVLVSVGALGMVLFAGLARWNGDALFVAAVLSPAMRIRMGFEIFGRLFYTLAIVLIPLTEATVILQTTPLVVVAGAAIFFGERVGWRRWSAIFIGLIGVLVILQPGTDGFSPLSILAILGLLGFAGRDLASRAAPKSLSAYVLGFYGFLALMIAGVGFGIWDGATVVLPTATTWGYVVLGTVAGVGAYVCLMTAMRMGDVSAVTPFRYTRLLFGITLGVVLFGETVTVPMMVGSGLIVLSGLFILRRGRG